jgi:hypothetical protein
MKSFHNIRCEVCNKFITVEDVLDDGMCEKCASLISSKASDRLICWQLVTYALAIANLGLLFWR